MPTVYPATPTDKLFTKTEYRDLSGNLIWEEPMTSHTLHQEGDYIVKEGQPYYVRQMTVVGSVQRVRIEVAVT